MPYPKSGLYVTNDGKYIDIAEIQGARIRPGSLYGNIPIYTSPTLLKIGAENLVDRHFVYVINSGSEMVYIGFDDMVNTTGIGIPLAPNEERGFELDPNQNMDLFAIANSETNVILLEVK